MTILQLHHVSRTHGTGPTQVSALQDASVTVECGELLAVMGPSGSGKSIAHDDLSPGQVLLSTQAAESIGLARSEESLHVIGALQRTPDPTQEQEFHTALRAAGYDDITTPSVGIGNNPDVYWSVVEVEEMPPSSMAQLLMLVLISFGVTLLGTVATTALTAAESRTDLRTLPRGHQSRTFDSTQADYVPSRRCLRDGHDIRNRVRNWCLLPVDLGIERINIDAVPSCALI